MKPLCFVVDSAAQERSPKAILKGGWRCRRAGDARLFQRRYLDSLDWRLLREDLYLIADQLAAGWQLRLFSLRSHAQLAEAAMARLPVFLPDPGLGAMNRALHDAVGHRALVSQVQLAVTRRPLAVVDDHGEVVARLDLEYSEPSGDIDPRGVMSDRRLWFLPVSGHESRHKRLVATLTARCLPVRGAVMPVTELIAALRLDTARFDARPRAALAPDLPCHEAARRLLASLLDGLEANGAAVLDDVDRECLHDFRVAVRRSRSLLRQLRGVIPSRYAAAAGQVFAELSRATNRQRDCDVMLLDFDFYRSLLPPRQRGQLDSAYAAIMEQRQAALAVTSRLLNSPEYRRFTRRWRRYLEAAPPRRPRGGAARPVKEIADQRIWKLYKRVVAEGGDITDDSPPEALHALRKRCKTLRYVIESFGSLYPDDQLKKALKVIKCLQDKLGEHQDLRVHAALLAAARRRLSDRGLLSPEADAAIVKTGSALERRAAACRQGFHKRFSAFARDAHRRRFRRLFKP